MENQSELQTNNAKNVWGFLGGLMVGGLAGAVSMLLFAPQSGKKTRAQIQQKTIELRDQTADAVGDVLAQTREKAYQIRTSVYDQAEALLQHGQNALEEQK
jgi:gas vesicle protein